jgi:hypothetical protein
MIWIGPYKIGQLLDSLLVPQNLSPPEDHSVYLISLNSWENQPTRDCIPLYVGTNTGESKRFRTRIGELIAHMFGFYGSTRKSRHHSGGIALHKHCKENQVNPKKLYIAWLKNCRCVRCKENEAYNTLEPLLNKNRPARCKIHLNRI